MVLNTTLFVALIKLNTTLIDDYLLPQFELK